MTSFGQVRLKDIWRMLDHCAPGHVVRERVHNYSVTYNGKGFHTLPKGQHGKRENPVIEIGHVRQMVRQLGIDPECASGEIAALRR